MKIIIEGAGQTGSHLAKMLSVESNEITVIEMMPAASGHWLPRPMS